MRQESGQNILLVEDDARTLSAVSYNLLLAGYEVIPAQDGADAIEVLKRRTDIKLVVSDIYMPKVDGYGLLEFVKTLAERPLFFLMTADHEVSEWTAINAGADGLFFKPFDGAHLAKKLGFIQKRRKAG